MANKGAGWDDTLVFGVTDKYANNFDKTFGKKAYTLCSCGDVLIEDRRAYNICDLCYERAWPGRIGDAVG